MRPPEVADHPQGGTGWSEGTPRWYEFRTARSMLVFAAIVASGWAVFIGLIGVMARLFVAEADRPSWAEVAGATAYNTALLFVVALALSLVVRLVMQRRAAVRKRTAVAEPSQFPAAPGSEAEQPQPPAEAKKKGWETWTIRGHKVVPTTTEGRVAVLLALVTFVGLVPATIAAPVPLVMAWRKGDRGLLLVLPVLTTILLVLFVVAEFTIGHE